MEYVKIVVNEILRFVLRVFFVFPLKKNRVVFNSYMGKQYSCNPKYISEFLEKKYGKQVELVWCFKQPEKFAFLKKRGIIICRIRSLRFYYYRITAAVSVCNESMGTEIPKRKKQFFINTWHGGGGGYKKGGSDVKRYNGLALKRSRREKQDVDLFCASSVTFLKNTVRKAHHHRGDYFKGTPRNDMFINMDRADVKSGVYRFLHVPENRRILLYAPTYREDGDWNKTIHEYTPDFGRLYDAVQERFGGRWLIAVRYHHAVKKYTIPDQPFLTDASTYPDMQELLYASDAMVTDYSSSIWDYSFTNKPCFLYCPDLHQYGIERGFNKPIREWGFPVCETDEELSEAIRSWDTATHVSNMEIQHRINGSFEDGTATKRLCDIILEKCGISVNGKTGV